MVQIDRVVTKGGDGGQTFLGDGTRVSKADPLVEALGAVDEANACIGVLRLHVDLETNNILTRIQNDLFDAGADLCSPTGDVTLRIGPAAIERLEQEVVAMNGKLSPLTSFILPGGTAGAAYAHLTRTIVRRAERAVVAAGLSGGGVQRYLNRLSDHLFVLSRRLNANSSQDVLWVPGANQR